MFGFHRIAAIRRIVKFAAQVPDCSATLLRLLPSNEPDILIIIRGRAILLKLIPRGTSPTDAEAEAADRFQRAGARVVFVRDDAARVLEIIAQVAEDQERLRAHDPRRDLR